MRYELYYQPSIQGRGEFVRLPLEDTGAEYIDVARDPNFGRPGIMKFLEDPSLEHPPFAPPFLKAGKVLISQTANILQFLAPRLGLVPKSEASRLWVHQLQLTIADWLYETGQTHHPIANVLYYEQQMDESKKRAAHFTSMRIPKFLGYFERILKLNARRRLYFRQESLLRRSLPVPDDQGNALRLSKNHGATRTATPENGHFTRSRHGASANRRLPIVAAAAGVQRARHFPPLSRVGRGMTQKGNSGPSTASGASLDSDPIGLGLEYRLSPTL